MKTIAICCNTPMIWTFAFMGAEWYCRKCGASIEMMNADTVDATPELEKQKKENEKWFHGIMKDYIPGGAFYKSCDKCKGNEFHSMHATETELKESKEALSRLREQQHDN